MTPGICEKRRLYSAASDWRARCQFERWRNFTWASESNFRELTLQEFRDRLHDARDLLFAQFGIHRQRKHFLRSALRVREVAGFVTEHRVQGLKMQRVRIVHGASSAPVLD